MGIERLSANPLLRPEDVPARAEGREVLCTLNPGAVRLGEEILLLVRIGERPGGDPRYLNYLYFDPDAGEEKVEHIARDDPALDASDPRLCLYKGRVVLTSLSYLRVARSTDGVRFTFDPQPAIVPSTPYDMFGCEDPRITGIEGRYYVVYTAVSDKGVAAAMAITEDFRRFEKFDRLIFPPYQKDVALFPQKVGGLYACRHRPYATMFNPASIWTAYSPDLHCWGHHAMTLAPVPGTWEGQRLGCGAQPLPTDHGWLEIYHAVDESGRYCLGAMLSDLDRPERVIGRSRRPVLEPEADYERAGVYADCVFANGIVAEADGTLRIYYGAADRICAGAVTTVAEMVHAARS